MSSLNDRLLTYSLAINEALSQSMSEDRDVILIGQGVTSPWYVGNTCFNLLLKFGAERVIDTPISENACTGVAVGASMVGLKPIVVFPRMDFMLYAMDPIINEAANWRYMTGGAVNVPIVFWAIINRGGEQAAQHSQAFHTFFTNVPGLKVVAPSNPKDAKGLMISAIKDPDPVVFIDDRWLYDEKGNVPRDPYQIPIGRAKVLQAGNDITIVSFSYLVGVTLKAAKIMGEKGISPEIIDLRSLKPLDLELIYKSCRKTRRLMVCDIGWKDYGMAAEIITAVSESGVSLISPPRRIALPNCPAPASRSLEQAYYPDSEMISDAAVSCFK